MLVREPAVAGTFYPGDPIVLQQQIEHFLFDAKTNTTIAPKALIVPHAGYIYSGPTAASAYQLLVPLAHKLSKVVLLGPSHRVPLKGLAAPTSKFFQTPLGDIPVDRNGIDILTKLSLAMVDDLPHQLEHSLEVQLPFLQTVLNEFSVLPLVVGDASSDQVAEALRCVWGDHQTKDDETLIVVSSDLSHYHSYQEAQHIDRHTTAMIDALDGHITGSQACGCTAINGLLKLANNEGMSVETLDLRTSGDVPEIGNKDRVVGYGSYAIY